MFENELSHEKVKQIHQPREKTKRSQVARQAKGLSTTLAEYVPSEGMPWNRKRVYHVLKRLQFGANHADVDALLAQNPTEFIDQMIDNAIAAPMPDAPSWLNIVPPWGQGDEAILQYFNDNYFRYIGYQQDWIDLMKVYPFREKMVLFWHNHFVTEIGKYEHAPLAYRYLTCLRSNALGNFKSFTHDIGLEDAMLFYLDGVENHAGNPNENYARELLELFTMGIGNYTEDDIREIAKALTGHWFDWENLRAVYERQLYDRGEKTFFGRTGNFNYENTIDIIFEEREHEIAQYLCTKLYKFFVHDVPNQSIIDQMAQTFIANNFEIVPVLRQLLKSEHFFDTEILGSKIKSPIDYLLGMQKETGTEVVGNIKEWQSWWLYQLGQFLLSPVNVAGWPGYRAWISTTTLPERWDMTLANLWYVDDDYSVDVRAIANAMSNPNDPHQLAADLAEYLISVDIPQQDQDELVSVLLAGMPDYEWHMNLEDDAIIWRLKSFLAHLRQLPEYQLM